MHRFVDTLGDLEFHVQLALAARQRADTIGDADIPKRLAKLPSSMNDRLAGCGA
jgi:hypothetical protein